MIKQAGCGLRNANRSTHAALEWRNRQQRGELQLLDYHEEGRVVDVVAALAQHESAGYKCIGADETRQAHA